MLLTCNWIIVLVICIVIHSPVRMVFFLSTLYRSKDYFKQFKLIIFTLINNQVVHHQNV